MKGAAAPPPETRNRLRRQSSTSSRRTATRTPNSQERLQELGFEEGELEMFFETTDFTEDQLVEKYLDIAQYSPYNLNWGTERTAINAPYRLNVFKPNGVEYTKHDICEDTLTYFYNQSEGRAQGIRKKKYGTRKLVRKHHSHKRRHTRHRRTRHRRNHH